VALNKEFSVGLLIFVIAFGTAYALTPLVRFLSVKLRILDQPNRRKIHKSAVPLLGGLAIYAGVVIACFIQISGLKPLMPFFLSATVILIVGVVNDIRPLSASFRFLCQTLCALVLIASGYQIDFLPQNQWGNIAEVLITVVWVVGITNAFNYLDGMDGLAAGSAVLNLSCYAVILYGTGQFHLMVFAVALAAACLGFLPYNFKREKIFLGDAGSTFLGFTLAGIALVGNWAQDNIVKISIPVLIMGVPIFDMVFTTIMRVREGKVKTLQEWLAFAGRDHFHHSLVDLGLRTRTAVVFIYFITLSLGLSAVMISRARAINAFLSLLQAVITLWVLAVLLVVGKRRRSGWSQS
jgi:UDP-GlcNAc:undecaprenyl-phosphate/decaprenyl-phosphate GlcNAc-1-phosphate transferase